MSGVSSVLRDVHELTDPRSLPNLELWFDARYPNGIGSAMPFDGDPLSTLTDLSGNGRHMSQPTSAKRPLWMRSNKNLLLNSSGETTAGWASNNGAYYPVEWDSTISRTGKQSRKGWSLNGDRRQILSIYAMGMDSYARMPIKASTEYNISAYFRAGQAGYQGHVALIQYAADGSHLVTSAGTPVDLTTGTWTRASVQLTTRPDTVLCFPMGVVQTSDGSLAPAGDFAHADDAMMVEGNSLLPYVPAFNLPNNQPVIHFDGIDDALYTPTLSLPGNDFTVYAVVNSRGTSNVRIFSTKNGGDRTMLMASGLTMYAYAAVTGAGSPYSTDKWYVACAEFSGGTSARMHLNGSSSGYQGGAGPAIVENTQIGLGRAPDYGPMYGEISAALWFSETHNDATRKKVEKMLSRQFGVVLSA